MTKAEELDWIYRLRSNIYVYMPKEWLIPMDNALGAAIKALEKEPCEDAISRKAVVEYIKASDADLGHDSENEFAVEDILNMPPVTPVACIATVKFSKEDMRELVNEKMKDIVVERKKGKWLNNDASGYHFYGKCSECEQEFCVDAWYTQNMNYCPNCGCRMERAKNEQKK